MSTTIDPLIPIIKAERPLTYFATDVINNVGAIDPLSRVIPCFTDNRPYFGGFACNIVVFTKLYLNGSSTWDSQHATTKAKLITAFPKFARYELHFLMDSGATDILTANSSDKTTFENKLISLTGELAAYNVAYHGRKANDQLKAAIDGIIDNFNTKIKAMT